MAPFSPNRLTSYLERAARLYVWLMLSIYGSGKIANGQFYRHGELPEAVANLPLAEVGGFDLAWTFFGYSFGYILFIGGSQLVGAALLLFERTKLIGAALLLPILANIIVVDYFFRISWGAMSSAIGYTLALGYVLFYNRDRVRAAWSALTTPSPTDQQADHSRWRPWLVAAGTVLIFVFLENQLLNLVGR